jgi:hypothetical protein
VEAETLRKRIRTKLELGELTPNTRGRVLAGKGRGLNCNLCLLPIAPDQTEFETTDARSLLVHLLWHRLLGRPVSESVTGTGAHGRGDRRRRGLMLPTLWPC